MAEFDKLMSNPFFGAGMGILQGQTPSRTRPNFAANAMGGLQNAMANRDNIAQLAQRKQQEERQQAEWEMKKAIYDRQQAALKQRLSQYTPPVSALPKQGMPTSPAETGIGMTPGMASIENLAPISPPSTIDPYKQTLNAQRDNLVQRLQTATTLEEADSYENAILQLDTKIVGMDTTDQQFRGFVRTPDGDDLSLFSNSMGQLLVQDPNNPQAKVQYTPDMGTVLSTSQVSTYGNQLLTAGGMDTLVKDYDNMVNGMQSLDYTYKLSQLGAEGYERIKVGLSGKLRAYFGQELTNDQLAQLLTDGELRKLVGQSRIELFGGGPLTDSEAELALEIMSSGTPYNKVEAMFKLQSVYADKKRRLVGLESRLRNQYASREQPWEGFDTTTLGIDNVKSFLEIYNSGDF
tara:strand:+ start:102 stop:1319 length:1218 start_codon:yes stop_codon:yes gene_type:complete